MWTELFYLAALALYAVIVVSTVLVVVLENRQPDKTIAWILVITLLPAAGLVVFYFFGQNVRRQRLISRRTLRLLAQRAAPPGMPRADADDLPPRYAPLIGMLGRKGHALPSAANRLDVLPTGADFLAALLRDIASARRHIHIETYIIEADAVGNLLTDALIDAARRGVEVRLLYDDVGCWSVPETFFRRLAEGGVEAEAFMPVRFPSLARKVNYRNHRKICVVDGQKGYVGGMNFARRYVSRRDGVWRDLHLRIRGGGVAGLQRVFLADWCFATGREVADSAYFPLPATTADIAPGALLQVVQSSPFAHFPEIMYGLTWAIQHARRYLYLQTPYFIPNEPVVQALQTAAMSGVDVRLMVPSKPDSFWLRYANECHFAEMLAAGVRVFTYENGFLHSKLAVMDDDWCSVGSSNFDFRSFENNFEVNVFIYDVRTAQQLRGEFEKDMQHAQEITCEAWDESSQRNRLLESCTRIFSPLL